jgi:hypothetical protein
VDAATIAALTTAIVSILGALTALVAAIKAHATASAASNKADVTQATVANHIVSVAAHEGMPPPPGSTTL